MRTFSLLVLAILGFAFVACDDDDHLGDWAKAVEFSGKMRNQAVCFTIGDNVYVGLGYGVDFAEYRDFKRFDKTTGTWYDVKKEFPGAKVNGVTTTWGRHGAVAFTAEVGGKTYAYVGLGYITPNNTIDQFQPRPKTYLKDFYRFDPETEEWTAVEDFPGTARRDAVAFTLDNFGYVGTGRADNAEMFKDFFCFNPTTEKWVGDLGFVGDQRYGASAFVVDGAAYVCLGKNGSSYVLDVIKATPAGNGKIAWQKMESSLTDRPGVKQDKDYGRIPRAFAVSFVSNKGSNGQEYAYVAGGEGNNQQTVWKYNHKKDQWHQMEDLPVTSPVGAVAFTLDGYGVMTTGASSIDVTATSSSSASSFTNASWRFIPDVKEDRANDY